MRSTNAHFQPRFAARHAQRGVSGLVGLVLFLLFCGLAALAIVHNGGQLQGNAFSSVTNRKLSALVSQQAVRISVDVNVMLASGQSIQATPGSWAALSPTQLQQVPMLTAGALVPVEASGGDVFSGVWDNLLLASAAGASAPVVAVRGLSLAVCTELNKQRGLLAAPSAVTLVAAAGGGLTATGLPTGWPNTTLDGCYFTTGPTATGVAGWGYTYFQQVGSI